MKLFYTDHFDLPLPSGHRFPMAKYRRLRDRIVGDSTFQQDVLLVPNAATVAIAMAGGYAHSIDDIVDIHAQTIRLASQQGALHSPGV